MYSRYLATTFACSSSTPLPPDHLLEDDLRDFRIGHPGAGVFVDVRLDLVELLEGALPGDRPGPAGGDQGPVDVPKDRSDRVSHRRHRSRPRRGLMSMLVFEHVALGEDVEDQERREDDDAGDPEDDEDRAQARVGGGAGADREALSAGGRGTGRRTSPRSPRSPRPRRAAAAAGGRRRGARRACRSRRPRRRSPAAGPRGRGGCRRSGLRSGGRSGRPRRRTPATTPAASARFSK